MFEFAVVGPIPADRLGVVRQCIDCRFAAGPNAAPCTGFGPGCLAKRVDNASTMPVRHPPP